MLQALGAGPVRISNVQNCSQTYELARKETDFAGGPVHSNALTPLSTELRLKINLQTALICTSVRQTHRQAQRATACRGSASVRPSVVLQQRTKYEHNTESYSSG